MVVTDESLLVAVFGPESVGSTPGERAQSSNSVFVRSQDGLALDKPNATGRKFTAAEAYDAFGFETLLEAVTAGSAVLPANLEEPARTLREARERLGLTHETVATRAAVPVDLVRSAEDARTRTAIHDLQRIAISLGLDERHISFLPGAGGDETLGARLKNLGSSTTAFSPALVSTFAEAAWVVRTEHRLRNALGWTYPSLSRFEKDSHYGSQYFPAWKQGYLLADRARTLLDLPPTETIKPLRDLAFKLGIPVLQTKLPTNVAGATISTANVRGVIVNTEGQNTNVWVRRSTIAHELGHLLWDPEDRLLTIHVDEYTVVGSTDRELATNEVEARANAFAINFLAPRRAVERLYNTSSSDDPLREVMERFGISLTAAKYHVWNACDRSFNLEMLRTSDPAPTEDWRALESFSDDYFPINTTPALRRGTFAKCVVSAQQRRFIHEDTAALYLQTSVEQYRASRNDIAGMFDQIDSWYL